MKKAIRLFFVLFVVLCSFCFTSCENPLFIDVSKLYTVKFETNGGTPIESYRTSRIESIPTIEKTDATFVGWYTSASFSGNPITLPLDITQDTTLYAKWNQRYTVLFETNGGTEIESYKTDVIRETPQTTKDGYMVEGWYTNPGFDGEAVSFPFIVTTETKLYAKWIPAFTVTFETNGGSLLESKRTVIIRLPPYSEKVGFSLVGWYFDEECTEQVSFPLQITRTMKLYAKWARNFTVTYESNGGSHIENAFTWKVESMPVPEKEGFSFGGWYSNPDLKQKNRVSFPYYVTKEIVLYAKWNTYTIEYVLNGGTNNVENFTDYNEDTEDIELLPPERTGYTFAGWYDNQNFSGNRIFVIPTGSTGNKKFYAKWTPNNDTAYFVKHYKQEENLNEYVLVETDSLYGTTDAYTSAEEKSYTGFHTRTFNQTVISPYGNSVVEIYYERNVCSISFDANGGSGSNYTQVFYYDITQDLASNQFTRLGYSFNGWTLSEDSEDVYSDEQVLEELSINEILSMENNAAITLYANWSFGIRAGTYLNLSALTDTFTLKVIGTITSRTILDLASMIEKASADIILDLSETTGLTEIKRFGSGTYSLNNNSDFYKCYHLKSVILPDCLKSLGDYAFCGCSCLENVILPENLSTIGESAFYNCFRLKNIRIPNTVKTIKASAFQSTGITSITIPNSVREIQRGAFQDCPLTDVTLPEKLTAISNDLFRYCKNLSSIIIPSSVIEIGTQCFWGCEKLSSITIPSKVTNIGWNVFLYCNKLTNIIFEDTSTWYYTDNYDYQNCTEIPSQDLTSSTVAALYLTSTYVDKLWYKE